MRYILVFTFLLVFQWNSQAQEVIAKYKFGEAEQAFNNGNYSLALQNLGEVDKLLGKATPATLYLKIQARNKMIADDPAGKIDELARLQDDYLYYLKNFENTDETKYIEVYGLSEQYLKKGLDPAMVKGALAGDAAAKCRLGEVCFHMGQFTNAKKLLLQSVAENYQRANAKLGMIYYFGFGGEADSVKAIACAMEAAKLNDWWSLICLGENNANRSEARALFDRAYPLVVRAEKEGDQDAAYFLGWCSENGIGESRDYSSALQWYRKAAANPNSVLNPMATQRAQGLSNYLTIFENAEAKFKAGDFDTAASEYLKAEKTNFGDKKYLKEQIALSYKNLAGQYYGKGDYSNSASLCKFALKYSPDDRELVDMVAASEKKILLMKEDDVYKAASGIKDGSKAVEMWENYANLYPDGKYIAEVNRLLEMNYIYLGSLFRTSGSYSEARSMVERYLKRFPNGKDVKRATNILEACDKHLR